MKSDEGLLGGYKGRSLKTCNLIKIMKELIQKKLDEKVRAYLRKEFPGMRLNKYIKINKNIADVYGFDGMQILVAEMGDNQIGYQLITNSK